ncbi:hypothetical protein AYO21_11376 [Fonsecaea monophora]|uniref:Uncharacterized protein n=1 Tax=Fonsecaea monophora TaxID=254056 RepID=A0A177ER78_9EURO|nr:hypothetical protein AYO21_11376 [Fonsecaea monophora]OAG34467.1 hypothetical protein AYO21_11376 [Fonsecaea monophora]
MPIPPNILSLLRQPQHHNVHLRVLKRQMSDDAVNLPELDFDLFNSFPLAQTHIDRNNFGSVVYSSYYRDKRFLRLHFLVPYYPAHEGTGKEEWMRRKMAVATTAMGSLPNLTSIYATDYQGQLPSLIPTIANLHAPTLQVLKLHSLPVFTSTRPKGLSYLNPDQIQLMATHLTSLTHLEMDIPSFGPTQGDKDDLAVTPFLSPTPTTTALSTLIRSIPTMRTIRLWIEVPTEKSCFQDKYTSIGTNPPPLKQDQLCQAVANLYALLMDRAGGEGQTKKLDYLEVAFTRLDTWDRQGAYPRFLPVKLIPSVSKADDDHPQGGNGPNEGLQGGFTIELGEWQNDYAEEDIQDFISHTVGFIH